MDAINYLKEIKAIKPILRSAAQKCILPHYQHLKKEEIMVKGREKEVLTVADKASSDFILKHCRVRYPASFSEEEITDARTHSNAFWEIDPIDGTREFIAGTGGFVIQAALIVKANGKFIPMAGIIYHPILDVFLYAYENKGPFIEEKGKISIAKPPYPASEVVSAPQRDVDEFPELVRFCELLKANGEKVSVVRTGGAGDTVLCMFIGTKKPGGKKAEKPNLYLFPRGYSKEWDTAPLEIIVKNAGGWASDICGRELEYNKKDLHNKSGFVFSFLPKNKVMAWINEFGVENLIGKSR